MHTFVELKAYDELVFAGFVGGPWPTAYKFSADAVVSVF
jgi:hypothetical protein